MAVASMGGGGGGASLINVDPDEMATIYNHLMAIITELEENVAPNMKKMGQIDFYTAGKAKEAMKVYTEANEKVMDLYDNYCRAATLVTDILNTMIRADAAIAEQIIAKLEI